MEENSSKLQEDISKKNLVARFGNYCCAPGCKSVFYNKDREKTNISLFTIPKRENLMC